MSNITISESKLRRIIRQELIKENKAIIAVCLAIAASAASACSDGNISNQEPSQDLHSCVVKITDMANQGKFNQEKLELVHKIRFNFNDAYKEGGMPAKVLVHACKTLEANPDNI